MLPQFVKDADGGLTYVENESPGKDKEPNWLPRAQKGPFFIAMRLYWPKEAALDGRGVRHVGRYTGPSMCSSAIVRLPNKPSGG